MDQLESWFPSTATDPAIAQAILQGLKDWCSGSHAERNEFEEDIQWCLLQQDDIGRAQEKL